MSNSTEKYVKNLEGVIKQMLLPLKGIPLKLVIESLYGFKILPFNKTAEKDQAVLEILKKVAKLAGQSANKKGILMTRANEVGNAMEPFVKKALKNLHYQADTPMSAMGTKRSTGYPDLEFTDQFGQIHYLESKTFNLKNINTTQRSFYLSPSQDPKITRDAHHFVISFEMYVAGRSKNKYIYKCSSWKILSIENLLVDVKHEFNADNARLYSKNLILAEGKI